MTKLTHNIHGSQGSLNEVFLQCHKLTGKGPCDGHCQCWCKNDGKHCMMCFELLEVCDKRAEETGDDECEWLAEK